MPTYKKKSTGAIINVPKGSPAHDRISKDTERYTAYVAPAPKPAKPKAVAKKD